MWLQPAAAVLPVSSTKPENRSTVIRLTEYQFAAESPREWMSPAASSSGGTPSTTTKRLKLQRAASRSYKRPRLLSSAVSQASREWICPTGGSSVCTREAKLEMTAVLMATALTTSRTSFSVRGADPTRLKKLFRTGVCSCQNQFSCKARDLRVECIVEFCDRFHKLTTECQGHLLATSYDTGPLPTDRLPRTTWYLLGVRVCLPALCAILGRTQRTLYRQVRRVPDMRSRALSVRMHAAPQRMIVDQFFAELYMSAAEHLPTDDVTEVHSNIASDDWAATRGMQLDIPTLAATRWNPDTSIESEALLAVSSVHAPKRSLQHGRLVDLWWQFVAWWDAGSAVAGEGTCPGWATFWRSWSERWQHALRFRKSSEHSQCNACWQYGQALARSASSVQEKQAIARNWREHLRLAS